MHFEPIAIVGQSCILPGALNPTSLWQAIITGQELISTVPPGYWQLDDKRILAPQTPAAKDQTASLRGGYVHGFIDQFDADRYPNEPVEHLLALDPIFHWVLHGVREALRDAGCTVPCVPHDPIRVGLILGNLAYPTSSLTRYAERHWYTSQGSRLTGDQPAELVDIAETDPRNRFCSGYPAHFAAEVLGLHGPAFSLDAACASSIYALKLACDRLHDRSIRTMVAGAVNRADDLFIHVGFSALKAMSQSGQSRPFDKAADGLIPAEGAAFVVLKRLEDAIVDEDRILGVIRGIGLSNDGRSGSFLTPSQEGQVRAMRAAYDSAGIDPRSISLLECHATGTPIGDAVEVESASEIFAGASELPIGSLKSNMGHLITAAGMAGLLKVLGAMRAGQRPPTLNVEHAIDALADSPFRLLSTAEPWDGDGPRRAAVSAFGFGGNNGHLIVEEWIPTRSPHVSVPTPLALEPLAIIGIETAIGAGQSEAFTRALRDGSTARRIEDIQVDLTGLRFPPADLAQALPQQLLMMELIRKLAARCPSLPEASTSILVGMGCDAEISRYAARWRLPDRVSNGQQTRLSLDTEWIDKAQDAFRPSLEAAGVIGTMPNIPANRLNAQLNFMGPSYTVAAEETSGLRALEILSRALRAGEIDAAIVGAVDLSQEPVHEAAAQAILPAERHDAGDGAVAIALKRLSDAKRDGNEVIAIIEGSCEEAVPAIGLSKNARSMTDRFGHVHAASGLLHVAAAATAISERLQVTTPERMARPWLATAPRRLRVEVEALGRQHVHVNLHEGSTSPRGGIPARITIFSGTDAKAVRKALDINQESIDAGPARLVIAARDEREYGRAITAARHFFDTEPDATYRKIAPGVAWCGTPLQGELGFVFTGAASAYPGMGRDLLLALPRVGDLLTQRFPSLANAVDWMSEDQQSLMDDPFRVLEGSTFLSQTHALLTQEFLGLHPQAVLGVSSGETNGVFALGAWHDLDDMFHEIFDSGLYQHWISGDFECARRAWGSRLQGPIDWRSWRVLAPVEEVEAVTANEPFVQLTMINAPGDCVIAGQADACKRVLTTLNGKTALLMGHDIIAHSPELSTWKNEWFALHHRKTTPVEAVRFYSNASGMSYRANAETIAQALTEQAVNRVDFRRVVETAWQDGVRIFLEHGPRGLCSGWIDEILGDRPHLALALDCPTDSIGQLLDTLAALLAVGQDLQLDDILTSPADTEKPGRSLMFAAHPPPVLLPKIEARPEQVASPTNGIQRMPKAPWLPSSLPTASIPRVQPVSPPPSITSPALPKLPLGAPSPVASQAIIERLQTFHASVSAAHQQYLNQQGQVLNRLLSLRANRRGTPTPIIEPSPPLVTPKAQVVKTLSKPGPTIDRSGLERLASGQISAVLGSLFERQDGFHRQVRMPEPPLLLADRVTGIDAEPGSMGTGTIWTETNVTETAWYLHQGRMPAGLMIEAGQADLLLISWLGVDFENRGERVYRLLGCELTYHGALPQIGDTLEYDIHIDSYAKQGPIRLFFFHYNCRIGNDIRLSVRHGQAGFFTDEELANSTGILWEAEHHPPHADARLDAPLVEGLASSFTSTQVRAFSEGRAVECFGSSFAKTQSHVRTPRLQDGRMLLFDTVSHFDPYGGPWGRGYLQAEKQLAYDEWFFDGHFKDDPCMPGTLMFEGCLQTMAFYLAALGTTIDRDGWRFEPVQDITYKLLCRGQITPGAKALVYELFIDAFENGPIPTLTADLLVTVDGLKVFHCPGMQLQLIPSWPFESRQALLPSDLQSERCARLDNQVFDFASLAACAWGKPSDAFGPMYQAFDDVRRCPRLPGPPYHFISRITNIDAEAATVKPGGTVEVAYDIPPDAWYFSENSTRTMPFCVLLEAALQPCGWLASYIGCALNLEEDLFFRNLDGTGTLHADIFPNSGTLITRVINTQLSRTGSMTIVGFKVKCFLDETLVYDMQTVFGFFTGDALANQIGLPVSPEERARLEEPGDDVIILKTRPPEAFLGELRLAGPMLFLIDRVTGLWPDRGAAGLGRIRGVIDVDPDQWFFKSHFYGDPVQPGSLGIEAMLQLLQVFMVKTGMQQGIAAPRFEAIALSEPVTWKYRGQVLPHNKHVTLELEIVERDQGPHGAHAVANAQYWVDGMKIYEAEHLGMRIVPGANSVADADDCLDPKQDLWLQDHCPTWTVPALAMMSIVDRLAAGAQARAPGRPVVGFRNIRMMRWLSFADGARAIKHHGVPRGENCVEMRLLVWEEEARRYELVASGEVFLGESYGSGARAWPPLEAPMAPNPYQAGTLFHGPSYQALRELRISDQGSSSRLDADPGPIPIGVLNQRLLDAALHGIPHDHLSRWCPDLSDDWAAYPVAIPEAYFYGPPPVGGDVRCEARFAGFTGGSQFPTISLQLIVADTVWAEFTVVETLLPKGPLGLAEASARRAFLSEQRFVPGLSLSRHDTHTTTLRTDEVETSDWLTGSIAAAYDCRETSLAQQTREIAMKEHVARLWSIHPACIRIEENLARSAFVPLNVHALTVEEVDHEVRVSSTNTPQLELSPLRQFWRKQLGVEAWFGEDLFLALVKRFISTVRLEDPASLAMLDSHGCLFFGNHQVGIESVLFVILSSALTGRPTTVIAKAEHRDSWIGQLLKTCFSRPGLQAPELLALVDREDQKDVLDTIVGHFAKIKSGVQNVLIHSEGTRALLARKPVTIASTAVIDGAVSMGLPIVPVRFARGLPVQPLEARIEFPIGYGRQDIWLGAPIASTELAPMTSVERRTRVLAALNSLGDALEHEEPGVPDTSFTARIRRKQVEHRLSETSAVLSCVLEDITGSSVETERLRAAIANDHSLHASDPIDAWLLNCARNLFTANL